MKSAASLSQEMYYHYRIGDDVKISHNTAYELLYLITKILEQNPELFDKYQFHPIQIPTWIHFLDEATKLDEITNPKT